MQDQVSVIDQESNVHLITSVRARALEASMREGISLDEFVNAAVAEKIAHTQHVEWVKSRRVPSEEHLRETRRLLRSAGSEPPEPGDELPEGFVWPEI
jgi:hypothetical protein